MRHAGIALNPADTFTLALDDEIRRDGMPGGWCAFALELRQAPDAAVLQARIAELAQGFPIIHSRLQQHGRRFYWQPSAHLPVIWFEQVCPASQDETVWQQRTLEALINQRTARDDSAPLTFHLLRGASKNLFVVRWLHPFCDARGIDLLFRYLACDDAAQRGRFGVPASAALVNLQLAKFNWRQKLGLLLKAKRYIEQIDARQSILPVLADAKPEKLCFAVQRLSVDETAAVAKLARQATGMTGTSLYYIGCFMRALDKLQPEAPGDAYCATYAFNLRKQKALTPLFGNHVGGLFAQAPRAIVRDRKVLFDFLKQQNAQVVRQQLDYAFLPLMWAGSWLPLKSYGKTLRQSYRGKTERSSFWFSDIGQPEIAGQIFCGADITGMLHLCQLTSPPALALLSCVFEQRLCLTYNYVAPLLSAAWLEQLQILVRAELLDA